MGIAINFVSVALGFGSIGIGVFVRRKKVLFVSFLCLGLLLIAYPFVADHVATRDAFEWKIVVHREINYSHEPKVIFVSDIEWITDYERIKRKRGDVRSLLLSKDTTDKEWDVKGYIPVSIAADIMYGSEEYKVTRNLRGMEPGSYTFTLTFDEDDRGRWAVEKNYVENDEGG